MIPEPTIPQIPQTLINNPWITLDKQRNGVDVQRAFAGIYPMVSEPNEEGMSVVKQCIIFYYDRELYPNGKPIKTELKNYLLQDLAVTEVVIDGQTYVMAELLVLTGFVQTLGYPGIINPARETLENTTILPVDVVSGYPLRKDTREKTLKQ